MRAVVRGPYQPALVRARARVCCERGCACLRVRGSASVCCVADVGGAGSRFSRRGPMLRGRSEQALREGHRRRRSLEWCAPCAHKVSASVRITWSEARLLVHACACVRTSGAAMRAWAHGLTIIRWNSPQFHAWNLSMIPRARVLIIRRSVPITERSVYYAKKGAKKGTDNRTDIRWGFQVPEYYPWAEEENVHFHSRYRAGGE